MTNAINQIRRNIAKDDIEVEDIWCIYKEEKKKDNYIKDEVLRDARNLFESNKEDYNKPIRINNAFNSNYIEYESNGDKDKMLSVKEYLNEIRQYLKDMIKDHKTQGEWKIQSTIAISFMSSKDSNESRTVPSKSNNIKILIGSETDKIIEKLFDSLLQKHQKGIEESMRGSEFVLDSVDLLYYKLHKISLNRGGSYIDSPKWLKNKKATINPKNNDGKCFQYALTVVLNYQNIKNNPERIPKIKSFMDQYNWKEINFPSHKKDWKKFESSNKSIALNTYMYLTLLKK